MRRLPPADIVSCTRHDLRQAIKGVIELALRLLQMRLELAPDMVSLERPFGFRVGGKGLVGLDYCTR